MQTSKPYATPPCLRFNGIKFVVLSWMGSTCAFATQRSPVASSSEELVTPYGVPGEHALVLIAT